MPWIVGQRRTNTEKYQEQAGGPAGQTHQDKQDHIPVKEAMFGQLSEISEERETGKVYLSLETE